MRLLDRRRGGAVLFCVLLAIYVSPVWADTPVASIGVEGNHRIEAATIRSYFHAEADGHYKLASLDAGLKDLIITGLFDQVRIDRTGDGVVVHLVEAKLLGRVAFEGNKKVNDEDLKGMVQSKSGGPLQKASVQADINRIIEKYRAVGRDEVRVVPEMIDRGNDTVDLIFGVTEGKKTTIRQVNFVGNHVFSRRQLAAIITTSATDVLSFLTHADIYDADRIMHDREQLQTYYRNHGYADAQIADAKAAYDPGTSAFEVTFIIDEGAPYQFGKVDIESRIPEMDLTQLRHRLLARPGNVYDGGLLEKNSDGLALEMSKLGHPFGHATVRTTRDVAGRKIDVVFVAADGPRNYVERIEIHGNGRTRDYLIRREFDLAEGDAYNQTLIDRAERRLKALNYFKEVKITTHAGSSSDRIVVDVDAVDQPTGDFFVSGGYSTTDGWMGEVKLGDRNMLGTGIAAQASLNYGQYARGFDLSVSKPGILDSRATAAADVFDKQTFASSYQSYGSNVYGGSLGLTTPVTEDTGMQWRYSLSNQSVTLGPAVAGETASLPIQQAAAAGPAWVSAVGSTTTYSTLDSAKSPTSGLNSQLRQDIAGLGGDVRFLRTSEDARYYQSVGSDLVAMVRAQGGYITGWGGQDAPLLNSFFGGPGMVRGFAPNGFGPRDITAGSTMDNVGGSAYWATTAELQSGIPGVPDEYGLKASAFVDSGSVFRYGGPTTFGGQSVNVASSNILRSSVGVGLSWASPFGALAVNYAIPLSKAASDVTQPLNFTTSPF